MTSLAGCSRTTSNDSDMYTETTAGNRRNTCYPSQKQRQAHWPVDSSGPVDNCAFASRAAIASSNKIRAISLILRLSRLAIATKPRFTLLGIRTAITTILGLTFLSL